MTDRILATDVHVHLEDGTVVLEAGTVFDEKYAEFVTNPACFIGDEPAPEPTPAPAEPTEAEVAAAAAKVTADAAAAKAKADADALAAAGNGTPAVVTPVVTPAAEVVDYSTIGFPALQALAKTRELSGAGNTAALIARLEADDRDKAITAQTAAAGA